MHEETELVGTTAASGQDRVWHLTLSYRGTHFRGWQIQAGQRTVQGELQKRLRLLFRAPDLRLAGTSRTDAGAHALDQHVSFAAPTPTELDAEGMRTTLNRWLPDDVRVESVEEASDDFHARYSARGKAYTYVVHAGDKCHPLCSEFVWHEPRARAVEAMQEAAALLTGTHDFASFAVNPKREVESTVRTLHRVEVIACGPLLCVSVVGDGFLYKMVRSLVGFLTYVGRGQVPPAATTRVLEARDRCAAADSAPARGLFLANVFFASEAWRDYRPRVPPFAWPMH